MRERRTIKVDSDNKEFMYELLKLNKIHFKVEWLEGYDKQKPIIITLAEILDSELKDDKTWNMLEYVGSDWIDQMIKIKINNHLNVYDNLEHIRFTRIEKE